MSWHDIGVPNYFSILGSCAIGVIQIILMSTKLQAPIWHLAMHLPSMHTAVGRITRTTHCVSTRRIVPLVTSKSFLISCPPKPIYFTIQMRNDLHVTGDTISLVDTQCVVPVIRPTARPRRLPEAIFAYFKRACFSMTICSDVRRRGLAVGRITGSVTMTRE